MWSNDSKEHYLKLTLAVYKVTELLPEDELLRQQIRTSANKVLADLIWPNPYLTAEALGESIKELDSFLGRAQKKNLADSRNFIVLRREYDRITDSVDAEKGNGTRKEQIVEIIKNKDKVRVGELIQIFPQLSRRTLIRDLEDLYKGGSIVRTGNGRGANYSIKL
ncbi:MAG: DeoR family transcriptional regulator [Candidatus Nealsonbacteria bacterium]|nr:DeoR family transcriptional regulator [Candidatus Nealsonbacteria bacterium]